MKSKLCCLLNPEFRCIGCDVPICTVCAGPDDIMGKHNLPKCPATYYYDNWIYDSKGHALNDVDSMKFDRDLELQEKKKRRKKDNGKKQLCCILNPYGQCSSCGWKICWECRSLKDTPQRVNLIDIHDPGLCSLNYD